VLEKLTDSERRVVDLVVRGWTNHEAAARLQLSDKTVEWTLTNVYRKLGVRSRTELTAQVARHQISPVDSSNQIPVPDEPGHSDERSGQ
jgi:DNA-binding NarL/FixJ family response regulator